MGTLETVALLTGLGQVAFTTLFGYRIGMALGYGTAIANHLRKSGLKILGVDFNPAAVRDARDLGLEVLYGDATDPEFLAHLPLQGVDWIASAVPEQDTGLPRGI